MSKGIFNKFEARTDNQGNYGVIFRYKSIYRDRFRVETTVAIDAFANLIIPATINLSLGFVPLTSDVQDIQMFLRSNKPLCYKLGEFLMLGSGVLYYDKNTGELVDMSEFFLYTPTGVEEESSDFLDNKGNRLPAVICNKLSLNDEISSTKVNQTTIDIYMESLKKSLTFDRMKSKEAFISSFFKSGV